MAAASKLALVIVCFGLVWLQRRRRQRYRAEISRSMARSRRMVTFYRRQMHELALVTALVSRELLLRSVRQTRTLWVRPRSQSFLEVTVASWDDEYWKRNFRIGRPTFRFLCSQLQPYLQRQNALRKPLSVEERVAITLWRLGTNIEYRSLAHLFGVDLSTVCVAVHDVCTAIVDNLLERYIRIPTGSDAQAVVDGFLCTWGFPQCFGAVDGTHIRIIAPRDNTLDYYNRRERLIPSSASTGGLTYS